MTQNNNASMATVVETFIVEETQELIYDNQKLEQWNELVASLSLQGQKEIVKEDKSPIPFLPMKQTLSNACAELCPRAVDVETYDRSPIPLEILELVALSKKEGYFDRIQIWYDDKSPDPFCIGINLPKKEEDKQYFGHDWYVKGYGTKFLIGRWGDVKMSLDAVIEKAKKLFVIRRTAELKKEIRDSERKLEDVEDEAMRTFGNALPATDNLPF